MTGATSHALSTYPDVYMSSAYNGLPMRSTVAVPVFLHSAASLNFDAPSGCTIKGTPIHILTCSLIPSHSRSCSAVCPPPRAIPLAPHNRNPSNSYQRDVLTGGNTVTAICTIPLGPSRARVADVGEHVIMVLSRGFVLDAAFRMGDARGPLAHGTRSLMATRQLDSRGLPVFHTSTLSRSLDLSLLPSIPSLVRIPSTLHPRPLISPHLLRRYPTANEP
ncbi:hypothetical protein B0H14DRAFT_373297 [Mycena olivaceomarginata]|nr:hypothetical protein B0H14DRAFT_373297 [Mycena olivaceomarginata]